MEKKRWRILFEGQVQGVGFRFTTQQKARLLGIKGWVKNLPDGKVELEAEGREEDLNNLLLSLKETFAGLISSYTIKEEIYQGEYNDFQIRF